MAQVINQGHCLGENSPAFTIFPTSPAMPAFNLSVSPQSHTALPKFQTTSSMRPYIHPKTSPPQTHQPQTPPNKSLSMPENPQFSMPTSLWPPNQSNTSLSFQPQTPYTTQSYTSNFFHATNTYTQPIPSYT
jgi:hypothetical protein